ncbi:hypothetical protein BaRGS_00019700 [Batillaria attramentaria]|uniref:Spliceosome-associated protein CWC27 homolog n=1 Tax=Batillaria attramentaria TaxID=370345 RepID=A0ABD0KPR1_9CAEN
MSNIYIQEPPTNGKVLLKTSVGDIDIELWSKEAPKACRNFVQLCLEGYYDGVAFHRVVKDFIVQGGDPTETGEGGESVYGAPFKDEFHSRLRFVRRGLVAMANAGPNDNGSQFFFTMAATPELQNKHTIFGKVVGDTLYNMLKLQEVEIDASERPVEPHRILHTEVLANPYDDIVPRQNFSLLSFGEEAEEDEEQLDKATESFRGKSKSSHDLTDDPRLSSIPAVEEEGKKKKMESPPDDGRRRKPSPTDEEMKAKQQDKEEEEQRKTKTEPQMEEGKKKAETQEDTKANQPEPKKEGRKSRFSDITDDDRKKKEGEEVEKSTRAGEEKRSATDDARKKLKKEPESSPKGKDPKTTLEVLDDGRKSSGKRMEELKKEARQLQKDIRDSKKRAEGQGKESKVKAEVMEETPDVRDEEGDTAEEGDLLALVKKERQKYKMRKKQIGKKQNREAATLELLAKFQNRLAAARTLAGDYDDEEVEEEKGEGNDDEEEDPADMSWLRHKLHFEDEGKKKKVIDANVHDNDRYQLSDPRNPLTQRRRESSKKAMKEKR